MRLQVSLLGVLFFASAAAAESQDLATFMKAADEAAAPAATARADGTIVSDTLEGKKEDQIVLLVRPNKDVYIELHQSGVRALLKGDGSGAQIAEKGAAPADFPQTEVFASSDFTGEDLLPFRASHYNSATIVYRDANQLAVQLNPLKSQYSLTLITFDPSKKAPIKALFYKDTLNNLLKMRLDGDHQQLGDRWFPGKVSMETFALKTKTTLNLKWSAAGADAEKAFEAGALAKPSAIAWPAQ
jgi:hypothetical protein